MRDKEMAPKTIIEAISIQAKTGFLMDMSERVTKHLRDGMKNPYIINAFRRLNGNFSFQDVSDRRAAGPQKAVFRGKAA
jgi:hypothetical protein